MPGKGNSGQLCIHLDPLGGIAGDMFVAAMLDAFPELEGAVCHSIDALSLGPGGACRLERHNDGTFVGCRFIVGTSAAAAHQQHHHHPIHAGVEPEKVEAGAAAHDGNPPRAGHDHADAGPGHGHAHRRWRDIREMLENASLPDAVRQHAVSIFQLLAQAEARVHGVAEDDVTFHEIGAIDSICDIVAAAAIVASVHADWSVAPLPLGSGRVRSSHGPLPVPAPATALLLQGFETIQDGFPGERVTPTGAAIVRYLCERQVTRPIPRVLERSGIGFGLRRIDGLSNCVRVLVSRERVRPASPMKDRELAVIEFDVDDQSPEDLSVGLDKLRALEGVLDVVQFCGIGKKGRAFAHIRVLATPATLEPAIEACFAETTTIGLRYHVVSGKTLTRSIESVEIDGHRIRVKRVERPDGALTAKAEMEDVARHGNRSERTGLRHRAETMVLDPGETAGGWNSKGKAAAGED